MFLFHKTDLSQPLEEMESSLCIQQYIQQLIWDDASNVTKILSVPANTDVLAWQYEHLRQFILELNHLTIILAKFCTKETCPEMESEGQKFLCAAHAPPADCCAIDYMCHTIDKATEFVQNPQLFPGRMNVPPQSAEMFSSQIRRLYRLFLHAFHSHGEIFQVFEESKYLCQRFSVFALSYGFLDKESLTIPFTQVETKKKAEEEPEADENDSEEVEVEEVSEEDNTEEE